MSSRSNFAAIKCRLRSKVGQPDRLYVEMKDRFVRLHEMDSRFGFLLNTEELCYGNGMDLKKLCDNVSNFYETDIDGQELYEEISDIRIAVKNRDVKIIKPESLLEFIVQYGDESVYPNLQIALQIMLTIAVSIVSCERSFSKLKLILSYLRASMGQERLCDLALLSIEREETDQTDFSEVIEKFASANARKVHL